MSAHRQVEQLKRWPSTLRSYLLVVFWLVSGVLVFAQVGVQTALDARATDMFGYRQVAEQLGWASSVSGKAVELLRPGKVENANATKAFRESIQKFESGHWGMQKGRRLGGAPKTFSPEVLGLFVGIDHPFDAILVQGRLILTALSVNDERQASASAGEIIDLLTIYRTGLQKVLSQYDEDYTSNIFYFKMSEIFLLVGLLSILSLSFWLFFRPAIRHLEGLTASLEEDLPLEPQFLEAIEIDSETEESSHSQIYQKTSGDR